MVRFMDAFLGAHRQSEAYRIDLIGDPGRIRTYDHSLRRRVLYPTELRGRRKVARHMIGGPAGMARAGARIIRASGSVQRLPP